MIWSSPSTVSPETVRFTRPAEDLPHRFEIGAVRPYAARSGKRPILLLDDIFDKIDPQRMRHLLKLLSGQRFGQVLITDTDASRLHTALDGLDLDVRFFHLGPR
jgi:recombinational DNA repair ATPase RecF